MFIRELIIEEFASAVNKHVKLDRGFNLITGANETGKSTVCAFIKFIFYGFTDSKERTRYSSIKTGSSSGAMLIEHDGKIYRIARRASGRLNTVAVYDEEDGSEFTKWQTGCDTPGEYFLGISNMLYTRSLYVSQADGSHLDGGSAEAISNLLLTGDEALNLKKAKKLLDEARKALKLKRGVGGLIADCESTLDKLRAKKASALASKHRLEAVSISLQNERKNIDSLKDRIDSTKKELELAKTKKLLNYLNALDGLKEAQNKNAILLSELKSSNTYQGFTPDAAYEEQLLTLSKELSVYISEIKKAENKVNTLKAQLNATPPKEYSAYCELGKKDAVLPLYERNLSSYKIFKILFFSSCFLLFVSAVAIGLHLLKLTGKPGIFIQVLLAVSFCGSVAFGILRLLPKKLLTRMHLALLANENRKIPDICRECDEYEQKLHSSELEFALNALQERIDTAQPIQKRLNFLLSQWNKKTVDIALADYSRYASRYNELEKERQNNVSGEEVLNAYISAYTEQEIALARSLPKDTVFPEEGDASEELVRRLELMLEQARERKSSFELELAGTATQSDIDEITSEIERTEEKLFDYKEKYEAIELAISSLDTAELHIRKTVSPYLSENSSKYFERITKGRYSALRLDGEMNLSYITSDSENVTDSAYFSMGSADLAWLCLRLALHKRLSENTVIPIIFDEALVYFDDERLSLILAELSNMATNGVQVILLSASSRELSLLDKTANVISLD